MGTEAVLVGRFDLAPYRFQIWFQILYMTVVSALPALEWNRRPDLGAVVEHRSALSVGRWLLLAVFLSVVAIPAVSDAKDFVAVMVCFFAGFCAALADLAATEASLRALVSRREPRRDDGIGSDTVKGASTNKQRSRRRGERRRDRAAVPC